MHGRDSLRLDYQKRPRSRSRALALPGSQIQTSSDPDSFRTRVAQNQSGSEPEWLRTRVAQNRANRVSGVNALLERGSFGAA
jgi:hypothetical protein